MVEHDLLLFLWEGVTVYTVRVINMGVNLTLHCRRVLVVFGVLK